MHRRRRVRYDQISAVSVNENKHEQHLQTGLMRYMILKLHGNETRIRIGELVGNLLCLDKQAGISDKRINIPNFLRLE